MRGAAATGRAAGADERFVHDAPDRAGAAAALGTATETAINLAGRTRRRRGAGAADLGVAQDVAGTDDHRHPGTGASRAMPHPVSPRLRQVKEIRSLKVF